LRRFRKVHNGIFTVFSNQFIREFFEKFVKDKDPFIKDTLIPAFEDRTSDVEDLYEIRLINSLKRVEERKLEDEKLNLMVDEFSETFGRINLIFFSLIQDFFLERNTR